MIYKQLLYLFSVFSSVDRVLVGRLLLWCSGSLAMIAGMFKGQRRL